MTNRTNDLSSTCILYSGHILVKPFVLSIYYILFKKLPQHVFVYTLISLENNKQPSFLSVTFFLNIITYQVERFLPN